MASLMENLIFILDKENTEYGFLIELSKKKTPIIIEGNLEQLAAITDEEQIVVSRIYQLEKKREEAIHDIADVLNREVEDLKLVNLIQMLANRPEEQNRLANVHDKLKNTLKEMAALNEHNKALIANALDMVEFDLNLIQAMSQAPETANYNKGAYSAGSLMNSMPNGFDAKQ